ncbi:hypothetical protein [Anderseniella sp. Alg231-50]|uniref:hypothetical protein n=1 Tax=Anderseniella sp. Alg231-50 TaxID=1922226 RepID=UPI00307C6B05
MIRNSKAKALLPANGSTAMFAIAAALVFNTLSPAHAATSARMFSSPDYLGQPVAFCLEGDRGCGKPAATVWCQRNGYETALSYARRSPAAGTELRFVDTGNICTSGNCISFRQIRCLRQTD